MGNISTYANNQPVLATDKVLGTSAAGDTKNFEMVDIATFVQSNSTQVTNKTGPYVLTAADVNTFLQFASNGSTITTVASTDLTFPIYSELKIQFTVAGTMTVLAGSGCSITGTATLTSQYQVKTLKRISATVWSLY